jgi:hypothetical protein
MPLYLIYFIMYFIRAKYVCQKVRSMYRAGSLRAVGEEISKDKLDLVGVQEVRWDGGCTE